MHPVSTAIRTLLLKSVEEAGDHPILLSGGVDSATVLAAALELGRRPHCFTYTTQSAAETSLDLKMATLMTEAHGLSHTVVTVPSSNAFMLGDLIRVLPFIVEHGRRTPECKAIYKVWVQCVIPMMYLSRELKRQGFNKALTGFCADAYYGSGRAAAKLMAQGFQVWQDYRVKYVEHPANADWVCKSYAKEEFGIDLHDCWVHRDIQAFMLNLMPAEMNQPRTKWCTIEAFPEFWLDADGRAPLYRENASLQVVGGVRADHDRLLLDAVINPKQHKVPIALYYDLAERLGIPARRYDQEKSVDIEESGLFAS